MNPILELQKARLRQALEIIKKFEDGTEINHVIAILQYNLGVGEEKARSYLKIFHNMGEIELKNGKIYKKQRG
jgi:hypothetical protein